MHNSEDKKKPEYFSKFVQESSDVQHMIDYLRNYRKIIEEDASKAKAQIMKDISDLYECLRIRETQLLKQTDEIANHHLNLLQDDYAELHRLSGSLGWALHHAFNNDDRNLHSDVIEDVESFKESIEHLTREPLIYLSDIQKTISLIKDFGQLISAKNSSVMEHSGTQNLTSTAADHELLHKSFEKLVFNESINSKGFPALSNNASDWLRKTSSSDADQSSHRPKLFVPNLLTDDKCYLRASSSWQNVSRDVFNRQLDLQHWLRRMDGNSSCSSESIEMISNPETIQSSGFSWMADSAIPPPCNYSLWLHSSPQSMAVGNKDSVFARSGVDIQTCGNVLCSTENIFSRSRDNEIWLAKGRLTVAQTATPMHC